MADVWSPWRLGDARCLGYKINDSRLTWWRSVTIFSCQIILQGALEEIMIKETLSGLISADLSSTPQVLQVRAGSFFEQWLVIEPVLSGIF